MLIKKFIHSIIGLVIICLIFAIIFFGLIALSSFILIISLIFFIVIIIESSLNFLKGDKK